MKNTKENPELIAFMVSTENDRINGPGQSFMRAGYANGYVAIPPGHPCYKCSYMDEPVESLSVHGGITFSEPVTLGERSFMGHRKYKPEYIGTRNPILEKCEYITENKDIPDDWWILGFDTMHFLDTLQTWPRETVIEETLYLKSQLEKLYKEE